MGDLSAHFSASEFACRHCGEVEVDEVLVCCLEALRERIRRPIVIVSGYRCETHNRAVGGAPRSYHRLGQAADLRSGVATEAQAAAAGFLGIGTSGRWATHVDVRSYRARWRY